MKAVFERARSAVNFLEHHQLEPSGVNFSFAFHYLSNPVSDLAREVHELTYGGLRLTPDVVRSLIAHHLGDAGDVVEQRERTVARQAQELGSLTSDAHDLTEALSRDVGTIVEKSDDWPTGTTDLVTRLSDAERDLAQLRDEFLALRDEVAGREAPATDRDELTQALNQDGATRVFDAFTQQNSTYVMVMFSVDNLGTINRQFGNKVGDNVLNAFAATLRQVFPHGELIRWTGNEFIVMETGRAVAAARMLVEEALAVFKSRRLKLRGTGEWIGTITASAGVVVGQGEASTELISRARDNVLAAIADGGNQFRG